MRAIRQLLANRRLRWLGIALLAVAFFALGRRSSGNAPQEAVHKHGASEQGAATVWTCSMHPQIQLPGPGKCPLCFMDLIPLAQPADPSGPAAGRLVLSENARARAAIVTAPVVQRAVSSDVRLAGKVMVDETRQAVIAARAGGRIDRLLVGATGTEVRAGDPLALLYSPDLLAAQQELISALQALKALPASASDMVRQSAQRTFDAARDRLRLLGFTSAEIDSVAAAGTVGEHMIIRSQQAGVVLERMAAEGSYVEVGMPLFQIADLHRVWVTLQAYESNLAGLRKGQRVTFTVEAFPGREFLGTVSFVAPVVDPMSRTVEVRVNAANPGLLLKPQMLARAVVNAAKPAGGGSASLVVPATAPLLTGERALVYVEVSSDSAGFGYEGRDVVLGPRVGEFYVVLSGLAEGEQVVVNGAFRIDSELQIRARPSMMSAGRQQETP